MSIYDAPAGTIGMSSQMDGKSFRYNPATGLWYERGQVPGTQGSEGWVQVYGDDKKSKLDKHYANDPAVSASKSAGVLQSGPLKTSGGFYARYPRELSVGAETDYVLFQFAEYIPPFKGFEETTEDGVAVRQTPLGDYNKSVRALKPLSIDVKDSIAKTISSVSGVLLPMPQDLSTEMKQNWNGKKFTRIGATAIAAANGNMNKVGTTLGDLGGNLSAVLAALKTSALNSIPGVGGNLSINDIAGSSQGVVLNPNAELLYDSPDLREIGMVFKMVPQNATEASLIKQICDTFRKASLPKYGSKGGEDVSLNNENLTGGNWIQVPLLCKFTFMRGGNPNPWVAQYKPCAITGIQVNYTPDGTYATYGDGSPVATELTIKFVETKTIFSKELDEGF